MPDNPTDIESLTDHVRGEIFRPGDAGYDDARAVWNGLIDREPAVIVRCRGTADVIETVELARNSEMPLAIRGGGHGMTGHAVCDDGIVIDLSAMDAVRVNPTDRTVRVQGGASWDQVNHEALRFGLVPPGIPMNVGVAGFTLGGGMGVLTRTHGLASDLLREVDVVTADGTLVTASETERADLFWALRGGGGNFGVATSFEFDCIDMSTEYETVTLQYPVEAASETLRSFRDAVDDAPNEVLFGVSFGQVPPEPEFPAELHGETVLSLGLNYLGEPAAADDAFEPFVGIGDPLTRTTETTPYTELYDYFPAEAGERNYWKSLYLDELSDGLVETLVEETPPVPTPSTIVSIYKLGGETSCYPADATAYAHRKAPYLVHISTRWSDPADDESNIEWTTELHEALLLYGTGGEYINNQTEDDEERVRAAYDDHYERLQAVKNEWDPENLFRVNHNIEPTV